MTYLHLTHLNHYFLTDKEVFGPAHSKQRRASGIANHGYCSELILWKVETVGPLGKSGGVKELARINSPEMSAFASVAWIPTVLPRYESFHVLMIILYSNRFNSNICAVLLLADSPILPVLVLLLRMARAYEFIKYKQDLLCII